MDPKEILKDIRTALDQINTYAYKELTKQKDKALNDINELLENAGY